MSLLFPKYKPTAKEEQIKNIIQKLLDHPETSKLMDPLTSHYYLDNKQLEYFMLITYNFVKITNHKFYYTENISGKFREVLEKIIKAAISQDRRKIEEEMFKNETELLVKIDQKISSNSLSLA